MFSGGSTISILHQPSFLIGETGIIPYNQDGHVNQKITNQLNPLREPTWGWAWLLEHPLIPRTILTL